MTFATALSLRWQRAQQIDPASIEPLGHDCYAVPSSRAPTHYTVQIACDRTGQLCTAAGNSHGLSILDLATRYRGKTLDARFREWYVSLHHPAGRTQDQHILVRPLEHMHRLHDTHHRFVRRCWHTISRLHRLSARLQNATMAASPSTGSRNRP